jgi:putative ABC transport system permease protein
LIFTFALRSLRRHLLSTALAASSLALAGGLVMALFVVQHEAEAAFTGDRLGFDAVVGARGSQLQLVLNAVFHLETSPGNLPWTVYQSVRDHPAVSLAIPYALGDNYYGYRIVGTTLELFEDLEFRDGGSFELRDGRFFDERYREAVLGSFAAAKTGLKVGDIFRPYHGLNFDPTTQHSEEYLVVGVLKPTNTPADRVLWIPIEGIFRMEGHVLRGTGEDFSPERGQRIPDEHKEVSAVMLKVASPQAGFLLGTQINRQGTTASLAYPIAMVMGELFNRLGWGTFILRIVAILVGVVALLSNTAALLNTLNERRRDIAIMRSLGARRGFILREIVLESSLIGAVGAAGSFLIYTVIVQTTSVTLWQRTGVLINGATFHWSLVVVPVLIVLSSALCGLLPAWRAYQTDVIAHLNGTST